MPGAKPYGQLQYTEIKGKRMAYVDERRGSCDRLPARQPTSSYLWRNVMPHLEGLGRLVACDLDRHGRLRQARRLRARSLPLRRTARLPVRAVGPLDLGDRVIFVLHDWGSALGFDWANQHRDRVAGIAYMEAMVMPIDWSDFPGPCAASSRASDRPRASQWCWTRTCSSRRCCRRQLQFSDEEMEHYREPFRNPGEDRRPTLSWPRNIPIEGEPADVVAIVEEYGEWLSHSDVPKLFVKGEPGALIRGRMLDFVRTWPNQTEVAVPGVHFLQEHSADENRCGRRIVRARGAVNFLGSEPRKRG